MNSLDEVRVAGEGLERGRLIPPEERRDVVLLHIQSRKLGHCRKKRWDTVGELGRVENCASPIASLKAQDHGDAYVKRLA